MKTKIFAVAVLVITLGFVTVNTCLLDGAIGDLYLEVEALDVWDEGALGRAREIYEGFGDSEAFISMTVSHEDLTSIESCFAELIGYLSVGEVKDAEVVKSRLLDSLEHLRRLVGINLDSVI